MFSPQFAPAIGGAERQAERLGKALAARSVDVLVMTPRLDPESPADEVLEGLRVHRFVLRDLNKLVGAVPGIGLINGPWLILQIVAKVWRAVAQADIAHCHIGSLQSIAAGIAAQLLGRPVICKAAIADTQSDLGEMKRQGIMNRLLVPIGRRIFTRWVATTRAVADALVRAGVDREKIVVIPNGIEPVGESYIWRPRPVRNFLYLGRLSTNINRDVAGLIRAFDAVAAQIPDSTLAIVGDGDLLAATREAAAACEHADRIQIPGAGDAKMWLKWADCLVLPSRREGLSNSLLEAMANGVACIANDIPPNREVLADGTAGLLVPLEDREALSAAMIRVSHDTELVARVVCNARSRVDRCYSIAAVANQYLSLYRGLAPDAATVI